MIILGSNFFKNRPQSVRHVHNVFSHMKRKGNKGKLVKKFVKRKIMKRSRIHTKKKVEIHS